MGFEVCQRLANAVCCLFGLTETTEHSNFGIEDQRTINRVDHVFGDHTSLSNGLKTSVLFSERSAHSSEGREVNRLSLLTHFIDIVGELQDNLRS